MREDKKYKIYAIICPLTNQVRYVGKTSREDVRVRILEHMAIQSASGLHSWINGLPESPKVVILDDCTGETSACLSERKWVRKFKDDGCDLFNVRLHLTKAEVKANSIQIVDLKSVNTNKPIYKDSAA